MLEKATRDAGQEKEKNMQVSEMDAKVVPEATPSSMPTEITGSGGAFLTTCSPASSSGYKGAAPEKPADLNQRRRRRGKCSPDAGLHKEVSSARAAPKEPEPEAAEECNRSQPSLVIPATPASTRASETAARGPNGESPVAAVLEELDVLGGLLRPAPHQGITQAGPAARPAATSSHLVSTAAETVSRATAALLPEAKDSQRHAAGGDTEVAASTYSANRQKPAQSSTLATPIGDKQKLVSSDSPQLGLGDARPKDPGVPENVSGPSPLSRLSCEWNPDAGSRSDIPIVAAAPGESEPAAAKQRDHSQPVQAVVPTNPASVAEESSQESSVAAVLKELEALGGLLGPAAHQGMAPAGPTVRSPPLVSAAPETVSDAGAVLPKTKGSYGHSTGGTAMEAAGVPAALSSQDLDSLPLWRSSELIWSADPVVIHL